MSRSRTSPEVPRGLLVVLTAASGTGKSTVTRRLLALEPRLAFSVSHTTRAPREGEVDGVDYHFVSDAEFDRMVAEDAFVEWASVHTSRYGTSRAEVERLASAGQHVLFDVDVQGAKRLLAAYPDAVSIFMLPPSWAELERRLRGRGTEDEEQLQVRLTNARSEIRRCRAFRYAVVNESVDEAVADFLAILRAEACLLSRRTGKVDALCADADTSPSSDPHGP